MPCDKCEQEPCTCQRQLAVESKASDWIVYDCASPGCRVKIRNRIGQQAAYPICKWCLKGINQWVKLEEAKEGDA